MNTFTLTITWQACGVCHDEVIETGDWTKIQHKLREITENLHHFTSNPAWPWIKDLKLTCR